MARATTRSRITRKPGPLHIIALGGSIVAPNGIDLSFLKKFRALIERDIRRGRRFLVVIGGGGIARTYQRAAKTLSPKLSPIELDTVGMRGTQLNAELVRAAFGARAHPEVINAPEKLLHLRDPVAIAAGWMPGYSTDTVAVRIAEETGQKTIIIAGRPAYVYDRDFVRHRDAKPIRRLSWKEYERLIGKQWTPGMSAPVDPVAAQRASRAGITAIVLQGKHLSNLANLLNGKPFRGTTIR